MLTLKGRLKMEDAKKKIEVFYDAEIVQRIEAQATRRGLKLAAYVRQAVMAQLEADEASDPSA